MTKPTTEDGATLAEGHSRGCECGFETTGWPSAKAANERIAQHREEHKTGEPMPELYEFREGQPHPGWKAPRRRKESE